MKEWYTAVELTGLPGMPGTYRNVLLRARRNNWQSRKRQRGKGYEFHIRSLPAETQAALISRCATQPGAAVVSEPPAARRRKQPTYDRETIWGLYAAARQDVKDEGTRRAELLHQVVRLADHGTGLFEAFNAVAMANAVPVATLRGWYYGANSRAGAKDFHIADWPAVLMPRYTGRTATADVSPEAWDYFKADYLRPEQPAASACYERLQRIARERGWKVPSVRTLLRKLNRELPKPAIVLAREGVDALKRTYPAQKRDHGWYHAMQAVNADGHKFDVFVEWWDGEIVRPVMIAWQDIFAGKMLSWRIEKHESSSGYRLSFGDMIEAFGIPEHAYVDNGRGIAAKHLTGGTPNRYRFKVRDEDPIGIITQLGIEVHWTTPYHGQAKPIERAFRDFAEYVSKHPAFAGAYTGNKPDAKPENYRSRAVPIADFLKVLDQEIAAHNARAGRRSAVCNGRSFDEVFIESYERSLIRKATSEQRRLWLLAAEGVSANRTDGSVQLDKNRYWSEALSAHAGQKLIIRFDPDRLHAPVHCYTLDGRHIGQAECVQAAGFGDVDAAREHARLRKQYVNANKQQLARERRMGALEAAALLPEQPQPADPNSKVVRPVFDDAAPVRKRAVNDVPVSDESDLEGGFNEHVTRLWEEKKSQLI